MEFRPGAETLWIFKSTASAEADPGWGLAEVLENSSPTIIDESFSGVESLLQPSQTTRPARTTVSRSQMLRTSRNLCLMNTTLLPPRQHEMFMHHPTTIGYRIARRIDLRRRPVDAKFPAVALHHAIKNIHQRRLARPVLSEQPMHRPRRDRQRDIVHGPQAGEAFDD